MTSGPITKQFGHNFVEGFMNNIQGLAERTAQSPEDAERLNKGEIAGYKGPVEYHSLMQFAHGIATKGGKDFTTADWGPKSKVAATLKGLITKAANKDGDNFFEKMEAGSDGQRLLYNAIQQFRQYSHANVDDAKEAIDNKLAAQFAGQAGASATQMPDIMIQS